MNIFELNLNLYRSFFYVAKYGGFTKASKYACISQSSLSRNISNLEEALNKRLFDRTISDVTLTKEGKELYLKLVDIVNILNESVASKELNIGCLRFIADNFLDVAISNFKKSSKDIKVSLNFGNTTDLYQMLKKDELDLLICRYPLFYKFEDHIVVEKILDVENVFVCSKAFYEKEKEKMVNDDYTYSLLLPDSSEKRRKIEQYLIDNNINYKIEVELPNSNLLKKLILNDLGIGYINKKFVEEEILNGSMMVVSKLKGIPNDNITIIYDSKNNNNTIRKFVANLKEAIQKNNN